MWHSVKTAGELSILMVLQNANVELSGILRVVFIEVSNLMRDTRFVFHF